MTLRERLLGVNSGCSSDGDVNGIEGHNGHKFSD